MAVAIAAKVDALRTDFGSAARLADMLGVSRAQVTRWLRGSGIDPLNAEKVELLEFVWSNLLRLYESEAALAELELADDAQLVDLDDPVVLRRERLRPSRVATRERDVTQQQALALHERHPDAAGLRWWSTFESLWANVTLFDRAASKLQLISVRALDLAADEIVAAAEFLGLRVA